MQEVPEDGFNLRQSIDTILESLPLLTAVFLGVTIIGVTYSLLASPVYQGDVLIQIEEKKGTTLGGLSQIASALDVGQSPTAGEIEILKSREVIFKAIETLHTDVGINVVNRVPYFSAAFEQKVGGRGVALAPPKLGMDQLAWGGEELAIEEFSIPHAYLEKGFKLKVTGPGKWSLIGPDDDQLVDGAVGVRTEFKLDGQTCNILVRSLLARTGESFRIKKSALITAYKSVIDNLRVAETSRLASVVRVTYESSDARSAVSFVNALATEYLKQNVARRSEEAEKSLEFLEQQLPELKQAVDKSEEAFNAYRLARKSVDLGKEAEGLLTRAIDIDKERIGVELRQQQLKQKFQPGHPDIVAAQGEISSLHSESDALNDEIKRLPETQQEAFRLERDVKVNTDLYIALLNNAQQLRIARAGTIGNVHVIDFATPQEKPARPQKGLVAGISLLLGLILGVAATLVRRALNRTLRHTDEIERLSGLPIYATVPESAAQQALVSGSRKKLRGKQCVLEQVSPGDPAVEALRGMRMGLQFAMAGSQNNVVLITGPLPGLGKTFVTTNLGAVLAAAGHRILIIDADLRRPRLAQAFGIPSTPGLSELLIGQMQLEQVLRTAVLPNVDLIASGAIPPNPSELLARPRLHELLESVKDQYDYILVDTPPLLPVGDTVTIAKIAAAVFLVLRAESSTFQHFVDAIRRLENAGITAKGVIFNGVRMRRFGYGERYSYYYSTYQQSPMKR